MPYNEDVERHVALSEKYVSAKLVKMNCRDLLALMQEVDHMLNHVPKPYDRLQIAYYENLWIEQGKQAANGWRDSYEKKDLYLRAKKKWRVQLLRSVREFSMNNED